MMTHAWQTSKEQCLSQVLTDLKYSPFHTPLDTDTYFKPCYHQSCLRQVLCVYPSCHHGLDRGRGDCVSPLLDSVLKTAWWFWIFHRCCTSLRELPIPAVSCLFCSGCLFFVFGSLMNNRCGYTLGCYPGLSCKSSRSERRQNNTERTYIYMRKADKKPPTVIKPWHSVALGRIQFLPLQKKKKVLLVLQPSLLTKKPEIDGNILNS
jgi:hypothetical protein